METATTSRRYSKPPADVWPAVCRLDEWLESGLRWQIDDRASDAPHRLVARLWDPQVSSGQIGRPPPSTKITVTIEPTAEGSVVTVEEERDRVFGPGPQASAPRHGTVAKVAPVAVLTSR